MDILYRSDRTILAAETLPYMPSPFIEVMENIDFKCHCQNMRAYFKTCLLLEFHLPYQKLLEDACITTLTLKFPLLSLVNEEVSKTV